ncbi:GNAT family N-acetyltransferase [Azoarcus sp. DD4]|uniref:GNAT family N-acetyltransferase n=1 Tax=Azoarcus sp. DD4 TaxID=2027405 RepID=UPI00112B05C8|nr:GNAT family N-acetyltransferase [Azoarcus sp. DD4]QDF96802.1 GNAT family N-acetyltransferase [Azoarcus sp. DD4]
MSQEYTLAVLDWARAAGLVMPLRERVFVVEQGVPAELELDEFDPVCLHAVVRTTDGEVIATGRLLPDGHVGRMAVDAGWRGRGIGGEVLEVLVEEARGRGFEVVELNAQVVAMPFYARHGFTAFGERFMEAGIPHRAMRRVLRA